MNVVVIDDWLKTRNCRRKRQYPNRSRAQRAAECAEILCGCGRMIEPYECQCGPHYHIGHGKEKEQEAA